MTSAKKVAAFTILLALILVSACREKVVPPTTDVDCSRTDDATLAANTKTELSKKLTGKVMQSINDSAQDRVVTLTGKTNFDGTKQYAGEIAKGVKCVKDVVNNIEVVRSTLGCQVGEKWCCCNDGGCECKEVRTCPICK